MMWTTPESDSGSGGIGPRCPWWPSHRRHGFDRSMSGIRISLCLLVIIGGGARLSAQSVGTPASKIVVDQGAPDLATANGYVYRYYADGATTGTVIAMTCAGSASPFQCEGSIPAFTPGPHTVTLTASNVAGESPKSAPLAFTFVVVPGAPQNPRIQ